MSDNISDSQRMLSRKGDDVAKLQRLQSHFDEFATARNRIQSLMKSCDATLEREKLFRHEVSGRISRGQSVAESLERVQKHYAGVIDQFHDLTGAAGHVATLAFEIKQELES